MYSNVEAEVKQTGELDFGTPRIRFRSCDLQPADMDMAPPLAPPIPHSLSTQTDKPPPTPSMLATPGSVHKSGLLGESPMPAKIKYFGGVGVHRRIVTRNTNQGGGVE